jgi:hypothetical protein
MTSEEFLRVDLAGSTVDARLATLGRLMDIVKASQRPRSPRRLGHAHTSR